MNTLSIVSTNQGIAFDADEAIKGYAKIEKLFGAIGKASHVLRAITGGAAQMAIDQLFLPGSLAIWFSTGRPTPQVHL